MYILEMKNINKSFSVVKVLKNVHLSVEKGTVHALLGENGAGKSTLMNILSGVYECDSGTILFDNVKYNSPSIHQMEKAGLAFVHQELNVFNDLTIYENIFLCREKTKGLFLDKKYMIEETRRLLDKVGLNIAPTTMVSELKTSEKQLVEITRALQMDAKLFILDEPTTALNNDEIDDLFDKINKLKKEGKSFIFISHKMPEIFKIADDYTVLRNGEFIESGRIKDVNTIKLTSLLVGQEYVEEKIYKKRPLGEEIFKIENLTGNSFKNINFSIRKSEVVGFTGLAGCGCEEVLKAMFGAEETYNGTITFKGKKLLGNIAKFMRNSVGLLPSERKEQSVVPDLSVIENEYLAEHTISLTKPFIDRKKELSQYNGYKEKLKIKAENEEDPINSLSGGNQQKVFLAKWLNTKAEILLLDYPTQGVDVGAKEEIYKLILELANEGKAIIINTPEIAELKKVADRCEVFYDGKIVKEFTNEEINEHDVMAYATNAKGV